MEYATKEEFDRIVARMMERRELIEQSKNPGLSLAQKIVLKRRAKAIDPMAD